MCIIHIEQLTSSFFKRPFLAFFPAFLVVRLAAIVYQYCCDPSDLRARAGGKEEREEIILQKFDFTSKPHRRLNRYNQNTFVRIRRLRLACCFSDEARRRSCTLSCHRRRSLLTTPPPSPHPINRPR